jgi:hypothetical protein
MTNLEPVPGGQTSHMHSIISTILTNAQASLHLQFSRCRMSIFLPVARS